MVNKRIPTINLKKIPLLNSKLPLCAFFILSFAANIGVFFLARENFWFPAITLIVAQVIAYAILLAMIYRATNTYCQMLKFLTTIDGCFIREFKSEVGLGQYNSLLCDVLCNFKTILRMEEPLHLLKRQTELATLQSQINPHFLYNTLDTIRSEAIHHGNHSIAEMTEALSTFFRYSISTRSNLVTLQDELRSTINYFKIQHRRFGSRFRLEIDYDSQDRELLNYVLPKLSLQPIVENAISHGLDSKREGGLVLISIILTESRLIIHVKDDGVGMDEASLTLLNERLKLTPWEAENLQKNNHNGIALANVNQRIKLFFGEEYGIWVASVQNVGTEVEITIPRIHKSNYEKINTIEREQSYAP